MPRISSPSQLKLGQSVSHPLFGAGQVEGLSRTAAIVRFAVDGETRTFFAHAIRELTELTEIAPAVRVPQERFSPAQVGPSGA